KVFPAIAKQTRPRERRMSWVHGEPRSCDRILHFVDARRAYLFAALGVIYLIGFNGQWRIEPDGALYLILGQNLAAGRGYTFLGEAHQLAYPGLPYLLAAGFAWISPTSLWPVHLFMLLCGAAALALCY